MSESVNDSDTPQSAAYLHWLGVQAFVPKVRPPYALLAEQSEQSEQSELAATLPTSTGRDGMAKDADTMPSERDESAVSAVTAMAEPELDSARVIAVVLPQADLPERVLADAILAAIQRMFGLASIQPREQGRGMLTIGEDSFGFADLQNDGMSKRALFKRLSRIKGRARWAEIS